MKVSHLIDPEVMVDSFIDANFDIWDDLPEARRISANRMRERLKDIQPAQDITFEDFWVNGLTGEPRVRAKVCCPANSPEEVPTLLWLHGGGFVAGTVDIEVLLMQAISDQIGCAVIAVEYRLAPENPFPAALHDSYAVLQWIYESHKRFNFDLERIAVGGIGAGAGLAASLALLTRDRGEFQLCFQLLLSPMLDDSNDQPSTRYELSGIAWDRGSNRKGWDAYIGGANLDELPSYAVPAWALDFSNLPPAYIGVGSLELFLDESISYARHLLEAEVAAELHIYPGATHGFEFVAPDARISKRATYIFMDVLKHAFNISGQ